MTSTPQATSVAPVPVFEVDAGGALGRALGTGSQYADDVVLVEGPLAERLTAHAPALRVALPPPDGPNGDPVLVDVETVHVPDRETLAELHGGDEASAAVTMVALELTRPGGGPDVEPPVDTSVAALDPLADAPEPGLDPFGGEPGPDVDPDPDPPPEDPDVICLLFPGLRICRG